MAQNPDPVKLGVDAVAGTAVLASFLQWLPTAIAVASGVLGIIWFIIQIWESKTFQTFISNWRQRRKARKLRRLRAREKKILAEIAATEVVRVAKSVAVDLVATAKSEALAEATKPLPSLEEGL